MAIINSDKPLEVIKQEIANTEVERIKGQIRTHLVAATINALVTDCVTTEKLKSVVNEMVEFVIGGK